MSERAKNLVIEGQAESLSNRELIDLAQTTRDPHLPSDCLEWAEKLAVPLLRELARRLDQWSPPLAEKDKFGDGD